VRVLCLRNVRTQIGSGIIFTINPFQVRRMITLCVYRIYPVALLGVESYLIRFVLVSTDISRFLGYE